MDTAQIFNDLDGFIREHFYALLLLAFFISYSVYMRFKSDSENQ